jgi:thioredoxin-related protein
MTTYYRRLVTLAFFAMLSFPTFAEEVEFIKDNVRVAIDRAAAEGKLVFLDFWADYCSPCKLMEKYTFTDPSVINRMNGSYVPVRINIETFDGYDLKTQYNVTLLPTIIVLNSKGKLVARFEESMSASKLTAILEKYDTKKNRVKFEKPKEEPIKQGFSKDFDVVTKPNVNTKPTVAPSRPVEKPATMPTATSVAATRATGKENTAITANNATKPTAKPTFKAPVYGSTAPTTPNSPTIRPTKVVETPSSYSNVAAPRRAAEKASVAKIETATPTRSTTTTGAAANKAMAAVSFTRGNFTIQVGNFISKDNADNMSVTMKTQLDGKQKVFLISGGSEDSKTHRVMVGGFKTHKEATEFKKQNQINGFIQSYSKFMK